MSVVVVDVVDGEPFELAAVPDDGSVQQFTTKRADPAFGEHIRDWGPDRGLEDLEAFCLEDLIERVDEPTTAVTDQCFRPDEPVGVAKSHATAAWDRRNWVQVTVARCGAGSILWVLRILHMVGAPTRWSRPTSSPWMRRYPHVGLLVAISITSRRKDAAVEGRPGGRCGWVQWLATRRRCHRRRVSGVTSQPVLRCRGRA